MFFDKVTSLNRIVNIRNIKMEVAQVKEAKEGTGTKLKTVCEAVTYKFIEQGQEPVDNKKDKKKKSAPKKVVDAK
jgi:Tfp pilus assembly protein PilO